MSCRLWHVNIHQKICQIHKREGCGVQSYGLWLLQSKTRERGWLTTNNGTGKGMWLYHRNEENGFLLMAMHSLAVLPILTLLSNSFKINAICLWIAIMVDEGTSQQRHFIMFLIVLAILESMRIKPIGKERRFTMSVFLYFVAIESTSSTPTTDRFSIRIWCK